MKYKIKVFILKGEEKMKTRKLLAVLTIIAVVIAMMPAMAFAEEADVAPIASAPEKSNDIVILATSDVHCALDTNIGYAGLAAYRKQIGRAHV